MPEYYRRLPSNRRKLLEHVIRDLGDAIASTCHHPHCHPSRVMSCPEGCGCDRLSQRDRYTPRPLKANTRALNLETAIAWKIKTELLKLREKISGIYNYNKGVSPEEIVESMDNINKLIHAYKSVVGMHSTRYSALYYLVYIVPQYLKDVRVYCLIKDYPNSEYYVKLNKRRLEAIRTYLNLRKLKSVTAISRGLGNLVH